MGGDQVNRKLITRMAATLLALPILYTASSGPLMHYALVHDMEHLSRPDGSTPPRPATSPHFYPAVRSFYEPMFRTAAATRLEKPIFAYLIAWELYPIRATDGEILLANAAKPKGGQSR